MMRHLKYNFNETYLNESFFDDIEDALEANDTGDAYYDDMVIPDILKKLEVLFKKVLATKRSDDNIKCTFENGVYTVVHSIWYVLQITSIDDILTIFKYLKDIGCTLFLMNNSLSIFSHKGHPSSTEIDFYNIPIGCGVILQYITPKNLNVVYKEVDLPNQYRYWVYAKFTYCDLIYQDSISVDCNSCAIELCIHMKDFSFLKNIRETFELLYINPHTFPETYNYTGLPTGNYNISINHKITHHTFDKINDQPYTFVGIPDTVKSLTYMGYAQPPVTLICNFSLEGLPLSLVPKTEIKFEKFDKNAAPIVVLIGPYKSTPKIRYYKITPKIMEYVIKSHDYYIDCYREEDGPHKEYNPNIIDSKLLKKAQSALNAKETVKENAKIKQEILIKHARKILIPDSVWKTKSLRTHRMFKVLATSDTNIKFIKDNMTSLLRSTWNVHKNLTWSEFLKWITGSPYMYVNNDKQSILELVIEPAKKEYEKVKAKRLAKRKLERAKLKESEMVQNNSNTDVITDNPEDFTVLSDNSKLDVLSAPVKKSSNIEIVDYSDKALAIFGNTYDIKDKIKELGGKYNPRLKYGENDKKPGWIISKRKQKEIEDLIK